MLKAWLFAYLVVAGIPLLANQKPASRDGSPKASQPDQRGNEANPLVVATHAIQSKQEASEEAQKLAIHPAVTAWNIGLTGTIAAFTLGQVLVYIWQARLLRRTL